MILIALAALAAPVPAPTPTPGIRIEKRPAFQAVVRDVQGDYSQHPVVTRDLMTTVRSACPDKGVLFGIYPQDPDAVPRDQLQWQLGYSVPAGSRCGVASLAGYSLTDKAAETDAVLDSTLGNSRNDGLKMLAWLGTSGYVQVGPTRMEYLEASAAPSSRVRIVVPVRRRTWEGPAPRVRRK
jgi:hypothetical protein